MMWLNTLRYSTLRQKFLVHHQKKIIKNFCQFCRHGFSPYGSPSACLCHNDALPWVAERGPGLRRNKRNASSGDATLFNPAHSTEIRPTRLLTIPELQIKGAVRNTPLISLKILCKQAALACRVQP